jgi:hypothetical protein
MNWHGLLIPAGVIVGAMIIAAILRVIRGPDD